MKNHAAIVCVNDEEGNVRLLFTSIGIQGRVSHVVLSHDEAAYVVKILSKKLSLEAVAK